MGELGGFLKITRVPAPERDPRARVRDYGEIYEVLPEAEAAAPGRPLHGVRRAVLP